MKRKNVSSKKPIGRPTPRIQVGPRYVPNSVDITISKEYLLSKDLTKLSKSKQMHGGSISLIIKNTLVHINNHLQLNLNQAYFTSILLYRDHWLVIIKDYERLQEMDSPDNSFQSFLEFFYLLDTDIQALCFAELEEIMNYRVKYQEPATRLLQKKIRSYIKYKSYKVDLPTTVAFLKNETMDLKVSSEGSLKMIANNTIHYVHSVLNLEFEKEIVNNPKAHVERWVAVFSDYTILTAMYKTGSRFLFYANYFCNLDQKIQERHLLEINKYHQHCVNEINNINKGRYAA